MTEHGLFLHFVDIIVEKTQLKRDDRGERVASSPQSRVPMTDIFSHCSVIGRFLEARVRPSNPRWNFLAQLTIKWFSENGANLG